MEQRKRGRPKSLNRDHVLNTAMMAIWESGVPYVSINTICKRAEVSKPALYREFENEDTLLAATLEHYSKLILIPVYQILKSDGSFIKTLNKLIDRFMDRAPGTAPHGCLFVKMRQNRLQVGPKTKAMIDTTSEMILGFYEDWINTTKANGHLKTTLNTKALARFIESQMGNAMAREAREEDARQTREILKIAFDTL